VKVVGWFVSIAVVCSLLLASCGNAVAPATGDKTVAIPAIPANPKAEAGDGQITLTWDASDRATSYTLYWSASAGVSKTTGTKVADVTSSYVQKNLTNGTKRYFSVSATNVGGESSLSKEVTATPVLSPVVPSSTKAITKFDLVSPVAVGTIYSTSHSVNLTVAYGTTLTSLVPLITHDGKSISPTSGVPADFSTAKTYTVTADDGTTQGWSVTVTAHLAVEIYSVTASPTASEQVSIVNNTSSSIDISGWTIGDLNNPTAYSIPASTILSSGVVRSFSHTTIGFRVNDSGETIYLKNASGATVDSWQN